MSSTLYFIWRELNSTVSLFANYLLTKRNPFSVLRIPTIEKKRSRQRVKLNGIDQPKTTNFWEDGFPEECMWGRTCRRVVSWHGRCVCMFETSSNCIKNSVMMPTREQARWRQTDHPNGTFFRTIALFGPIRLADKSGSSRCRYILLTLWDGMIGL